MWLVMPVMPIHIYRSVGWEAKEFEKLVSDQQKERNKTELEKNCFTFPYWFYVHCLHLIFIEIPSCFFISNQQAATRTWWASTGRSRRVKELWPRRPRFVRRRRRKTPWPSRTTVIHWSKVGAKVGHRFSKETCPLKIVVLFFLGKELK